MQKQETAKEQQKEINHGKVLTASSMLAALLGCGFPQYCQVWLPSI